MALLRVITMSVIIYMFSNGCDHSQDYSEESFHTNIIVLTLRPPLGETVNPSDTMYAWVRVYLFDMDTSGGNRYWFTVGYVKKNGSYITRSPYGIYSCTASVSEINVVYPIKEDYELEDTATMEYVFHVEKGRSFSSPDVLLKEYRFEYRKSRIVVEP